MAKLKELAKVIRSKNSGPYEITFDIMFPNKENYERVKNSGVLGDTDIIMMRSEPSVTDVTEAQRVGFVFPCYGGGGHGRDQN